MKHVMLAVPAVALFAVGAIAQTDTTTTTGTTADTATGATTEVGTSTEMGTTGETFGTNWPLSVGTTFFTDAESGSLRTTEELTSGWQSLSQEDRDMIKADCVTFMAAHGDAAATAGTSTDTGADTGAATGTETTGAATDATAGAATDTEAATGTAATDTTGTAAADGTISTAVGYDLNEMKAICEAVETL